MYIVNFCSVQNVLDGPCLVNVNIYLRSISKISDLDMVSFCFRILVILLFSIRDWKFTHVIEDIFLFNIGCDSVIIYQVLFWGMKWLSIIPLHVWVDFNQFFAWISKCCEMFSSAQNILMNGLRLRLDSIKILDTSSPVIYPQTIIILSIKFLLNIIARIIYVNDSNQVLIWLKSIHNKTDN